MRFFLDNYEKIKQGVLVLLIIVLPFYHALSSILIITAVSLSFLRLCFYKRSDFVPLDKLSIAVFSYFILEVIGLGYTEKEDFRNGMFNIEKHFGMMAIPLIFYNFKIEARFRDRLFSAFIVSCFIATVICLVANMYLSLSTQDTLFDPWLFSHARLSGQIEMHPVYMAMYLALSILIMLHHLQENYALLSIAKKTTIIFLTFFFLGMILLLGARTTTAILMLIIVIGVVRLAITRKTYKPLMVLAFIPLIFAGVLFLNPHIQNRFFDVSASSYDHSSYGGLFARTKIWEPGIEVIKENFWFGVGTGDDQAELDKMFVKYNYPEAVRVFNTHDQYLQTLISIGFIGLLVFLLLLYLQFKAAFTGKDRLYLYFLILFVAGCVTESMLQRHQGIVFFLLFSFIFYRSERLNRTESK